MNKIKVILVDDHQIVRDGIKAAINISKNVTVIGEASNEDELMILLKEQKPDIMIMDISMPGSSGLEITKKISNKYKIIIFSAHTDAKTVINTLKAGAKGFLPKDVMREELLEAISCVHNGEDYISEDISKTVLINYVKTDDTYSHLKNTGIEILTKREVEILRHIAEGATYKEIADKLFISFRTVETHKTHIMQKLELKNLADLIKFAIKNKLIEV